MQVSAPGGYAVGAVTGAGAYPVDLIVPHPTTSNRFWAIPVIGILVKYIILIPHFIVVYVLLLVLYLLQLVTWIPVLFTGRYPRGLHHFTAGVIRWNARVFSFLLGLTDKYPPFRLS